jgi:methyl-accepting chemotaxis protein
MQRPITVILEGWVMDRTLTLDAIRSTATRLFTVLTLVHVPLVALVAIVGRNAWFGPAAVALFIAAAAAVCAWRMKDGLPLRSLMAIFVTCGPILMVYAGRGHASGISGHGDWQVDYHMYFFAVFAMLAAYIDWRPIAIAAAVTAGHHLVLDLIVPADVFPEEGLDRVILHALAVVAECGVLFWLTIAIDKLFKRVAEATELVEFTSREMAEQLFRQQEETEKLRDQLKQAV